MPGYVVGATSHVNGMGLKTLCPAAYGVSFMAGAEDGPTSMRLDGTVSEGSRLGNGPGEMTASELATIKATVVATIGALLAPITLIMPPLIPMVTGIMAALSGAMAVSSDPCQLPKPVLMPTGALGWTAATLPFQILRIGHVAIVGIPGEMTVQAGRRLENALRIRLGPAGVQKIILTGLANEYSGYITTPEEYPSQQYEGASTLFGRLTFDAYSEIFVQLADALVSGQNPRLNSLPPPDLGLLPQLELQTGVVLDVAPVGSPFGTVTLLPRPSYNRGEQVQVTFQGAHPKNDLKRNDSYFRIEREVPGSSPELVAWDAMPETKVMWIREGIAESKVVVFWTIPENAQPGTYRIHHFGTYKDLAGLHNYSGSTTPFMIR
jgi:neutral ceramidase